MSVRKYIPSLDGIRFFSFLFVFVFHALPYAKAIGASPTQLMCLKIFEIGWAGVDVFFVLSGFLISLGLLSDREKPAYFTTFYVRRILRIFPLYYAFCIAVFVLIPLAIPKIRLIHASLYATWPLYFLHLQNWRFLFTSSDSEFLGHLWTLAIEEQFYLVWPLCVFWLPRGTNGIKVCLAAIAAIVAFRIGLYYQFGSQAAQMLHFSTITRLDSLLIGSVLAMIIVQNPNYGTYSFVLKRAVPLMLMALGYVLFDWPSDPFHSPLVQTIGYSIIAFGAAGSIMLFRLPQFDHSFLANGPIRYLGKISYGLYVYHWPCLYFVAILFTKFKLHGEIWSAAFLAVTFVLNIVVAMISFHLFERAFLRLKDRFQSADSISLRTNVRPGDLAANPALASTSNELK